MQREERQNKYKRFCRICVALHRRRLRRGAGTRAHLRCSIVVEAPVAAERDGLAAHA